jgi:hypothetical protein
MNTMNKLSVLLLLPLIAFGQKSVVRETEEWSFSELKGSTTFYAGHASPAEPSSEKKRAALLKGMADNSDMPMHSAPVVLNDSLSTVMSVRLLLADASKDNADAPKGIAVVSYTDLIIGSAQDQYIVWRSQYMDSYVFTSDKITCVYTVHRNVRLPNAGCLVTYTATRNSFMGVSIVSFTGVARRVK